MKRALAVIGLLAAVGVAGPAGADVLCVKSTRKGLKGGLVARAKCKKNEKQVDTALADQIGIRGDRGPGLAVVNNAGQEVGVPVSSYYGSTTVALELTAAGGSAPEWFYVNVDAGGVVKSSDAAAFDTSFVYDEASCKTRFVRINTQGYYGNALPVPLAASLVVDPTGTTGYFGRASEVQKKQFYGVQISSGATAQQATAFCTAGGGTAIGSAAACPSGRRFPPGYFCVECCFAQGQSQAAPAHTVSFGALGQPPFKLSE